MTDFTKLVLKVAAATTVLCALGIGLLVWLTTPDKTPATPVTPATPYVPLTTEVPATPIIGSTEGGCSEAQKRACKNMLCATDACAACCFDPADEAVDCPDESCKNLRLGCKLGSTTACAECREKDCGDCGPFATVPEPEESCKALKEACDWGDVDACIEAKTRHCDLVDTEVGYSGAEATSPQNIAEAHALVEQAHEGIGNVWHNDIHSGQPDCGADCIAAINDAAAKTKQARSLLGADVLSQRTWDKNQTVAHAFDAAEYWINEVNIGETDSGAAAPHALFQLGILRDVLAPASAEGN